jgi:hypothetical protein
MMPALDPGIHLLQEGPTMYHTVSDIHRRTCDEITDLLYRMFIEFHLGTTDRT